jgi:hypothetical protein
VSARDELVGALEESQRLSDVAIEKIDRGDDDWQDAAREVAAGIGDIRRGLLAYAMTLTEPPPAPPRRPWWRFWRR